MSQSPKKSRPTGALKAHRQRLRDEAEARNAATAALTPQARMSIIRARPGNSLRERERLIAMIENGQGHVVSKKKRNA